MDVRRDDKSEKLRPNPHDVFCSYFCRGRLPRPGARSPATLSKVSDQPLEVVIHGIELSRTQLTLLDRGTHRGVKRRSVLKLVAEPSSRPRAEQFNLGASARGPVEEETRTVAHDSDSLQG